MSLLLAIFLAVLGLAACGSSTPKPHTAGHSYRDVESLVTAMAVHGAVCGNVQFVSSAIPGGLTPHVGCDGISAGDTSVVVFTNHTHSVAFARHMTQLSGLGSVAEVVGPDWVVNTVPAFARRVVHAIGGQLLMPARTHVAVSPSPAPALPVSPELTADKAMCKTFNAYIGNGGESQISQALLAAGTSVTPKLARDIIKAITSTLPQADLQAQVRVTLDCALVQNGVTP